MVFYRKYRPQTISELDSTAVRESLTAYLRKGEVHAFLFTGPKGLGKTSTARIVAKVVNCEKIQHSTEYDKNEDKKIETTEVTSNVSLEPCNVCEMCLSITNGTNLDVTEIDAASNRGIDEIRELKDKIRLSPLQARKKVYIIDEVHMLTTEAFNALLKTLEEPPDHALFILCTTEPHKVPSTVLSRCCHISFLSATNAELVRSFTRIATGENLTAEEGALSLIAQLSEGGFRDGAKILEEIASLVSDGVITKEVIEKKYRVTSIQYLVTQMITILSERDTKRALQAIAEVTEQGIDMKFFMEQIMQQLHRILLSQAGVTRTEEKSPLSISDVKQLLQLLMMAYSDLKYAVMPQLPLELAIIEWGEHSFIAEKTSEKKEQERLVTVEKVVPTQEGDTDYAVKKTEVTVSTLKKQVGNIAKIKALYGEPKTIDEQPTVSTESVELLKYAAEGEVTKEWLHTFWRCIISEMKNYNHTTAGLLRGCAIKSFDRKKLIIEAAYSFHKERLDEGKTTDALHQICKGLTGTPITVEIVLKQ